MTNGQASEPRRVAQEPNRPDGDKIGKLEDVYVTSRRRADVRYCRRRAVARHLTFVPLQGITIGPDNLEVTVSKEQVEDAPNLEMQDEELSQADESALYHHYQLNYIPPQTESGRRLARR